MFFTEILKQTLSDLLDFCDSALDFVSTDATECRKVAREGVVEVVGVEVVEVGVVAVKVVEVVGEEVVEVVQVGVAAVMEEVVEVMDVVEVAKG